MQAAALAIPDLRGVGFCLDFLSTDTPWGRRLSVLLLARPPSLFRGRLFEDEPFELSVANPFVLVVISMLLGLCLQTFVEQ